MHSNSLSVNDAYFTFRCLSWEQWEEETWINSVTLNVSLEGGNLVNTKEI